jgi:hypothetical protein
MSATATSAPCRSLAEIKAAMLAGQPTTDEEDQRLVDDVHEQSRIFNAKAAAAIADAEERAGMRGELPPEESRSWRWLRPLPVGAVYADTKLDEIVWLWDGMIPGGGALAVLGSYMKEGKTTLTYGLIGAMQRHAEFCGRATRSVPVLILALEEHMRDVKAHLAESGIGPNDPVYVHAGALPMQAEAVQELRSFIADNRIGLVVVDTLTRLLLLRDENANAEVTAALAPLLALARDLDCTLLLLHHTAKLSAQSFAYGRELRGAGAIFATVDQAIIMRRVKGGPQTVRELRCVGRYRESPEALLVDFDPETASWSLVETEAGAVTAGSEARTGKLLGYVAEHPGQNRTEVVVGAKTNRKLGLQAVELLVREGRLTERTTSGGGYGLFLP